MKVMSNIDISNISSRLREKAINIKNKKILITNLYQSEQEKDLTKPPNCNGFGRIHHFKLDSGTEWIQDPLPNLPAAKALGMKPESQIRVQVFQNSVCNFRCWYCFVDFKLLNGDLKFGSFLTCDEMIELYLKQEEPPLVIDLSGGHPDLTPEWVPWMMHSLKEKGLSEKIYLWSDDNLSNDYLWKYLSNEQIDLLKSYKMYSRVCCFKGFDERSFSYNTKAESSLFYNQFELCKRLLEINLDLYCYITLTAKMDTDFEVEIPRFIDRIQRIDEYLPLRIVPLRIFDKFSPTASRMNVEYADMLNGQYVAINFWEKEIKKRFNKEQLELPITEVLLKKY